MASADLDSWYHERESAWLYREVARCESDPRKSQLFLSLAAAAEEQAVHWEGTAQGKASGLGQRPFRPSARARLVARLVRRLGPRSLRGVLAAMKLRGMSI